MGGGLTFIVRPATSKVWVFVILELGWKVMNRLPGKREKDFVQGGGRCFCSPFKVCVAPFSTSASQKSSYLVFASSHNT